MFGDPLPDLAVRGERGIDIFERQDLPGQRRARFRCLGRVLEGGATEAFEPEGNPRRLTAAAEGLAAAPALSAPLSLTDANAFPAIAALPDPMALFVRVDFLRAWALADLGLARFLADPGAVYARQNQFAAQVALAYDFNRISIGVTLARALLPARPAPDDSDETLGFGFRMLGDLALRGAESELALSCFEAALAIGDNPHRRARARAAALAAGDAAALERLGGAAA